MPPDFKPEYDNWRQQYQPAILLYALVNTLVPASGLYYPNKIAQTYLLAMDEVIGRNGLNALLKLTGLGRYVDALPPGDLAKEFDFADFSNLNAGLNDIYGLRGGRGLSIHGGRQTFARGLKDFGALAGVGDVAFRELPLQTRLKFGLQAMVRVFTQFSDQITRVEVTEENFLFHIDRCPVCWGQKSENPTCFLATGLLEEGLEWVSGGHNFRVEEVECIAAGGQSCLFRIPRQPIT